jgi:hypothetical protein
VGLPIKDGDRRVVGDCLDGRIGELEIRLVRGLSDTGGIGLWLEIDGECSFGDRGANCPWVKRGLPSKGGVGGGETE